MPPFVDGPHIPLLPSLKSGSLASALHEASELLARHQTFEFPRLRTGLFPAAHLRDPKFEEMKYHYVWVRDNVHLAHHFEVIGQHATAVRTVTALCSFFTTQRGRFIDIIEGRGDKSDPMQRPHIRFEGETLQEIPQEWHHNQNDALGYFLWLFCKLARGGRLNPSEEQLATVALFPRFFMKIEYWQDEDSGHWEETPKIEASSIGTVVAGLRELQSLQKLPGMQNGLKKYGVCGELVAELIGYGEDALRDLLPFECIQQDREKRRQYDAALLFLIYPLNIVRDELMVDQILANVREHLEGNIGIARYPYDTFWCANYKNILSAAERTQILDKRNKRMQVNITRGEEAQWCLFDSIISTIHGRRFIATGSEEFAEQQLHYLNRSLRQLTGADSPFGPCKCPEAYYLKDGRWVPNDATPLLWAQANLRVALWQMEQTCHFYLA